MRKVSYLIVTFASLFLYAGKVQAKEKELDITVCKPEKPHEAAVVPEIIFSADYSDDPVIATHPAGRRLYYKELGEVAMPVTNIPNIPETPTKASIKKFEVFNNGKSIMSQIILTVNGKDFTISTARDYDHLWGSDRVSPAHPTLTWKGEVFYAGYDQRQALDMVDVKCTTTFTTGIDFNPLMRMPAIATDRFTSVFKNFPIIPRR